MRFVPDAGAYPGVPFQAYLSWEACHFSTLKLFAKSAAHAREEMIHPREQSEAMMLGQAVHAAVLEPDSFEKLYARAPKVDRRTREGKADWLVFEEEHRQSLILGAEDFDTCLRIRDSVWQHGTAIALLSGQGQNELSIVWDDVDEKLRCKGRIDRITEFAGWTTAVDLKTTRDASPQGFARELANYQYAMQNALYLDGLDALSPRERKFVFLAVEKEPPFAAACYELDPGSVELGRRAYKRALQEWKHAEETGIWQGYPPGVVELSLPAWAFKQAEDL